MESSAFDNISLQAADVKTPDYTGYDNTDVDELSIKQQKSKRYSQNTKYRKYFSLWVMCIVPLWLLAVLVLLVLCGCGVLHLSDATLTTLLATTTVNILGLAYIVLKGMFPQERE